MRFGPLPTPKAIGAILAHGVTAGQQRFRKGRVLSASDIDALAQAGIAEVHVARLDPDDVTEDVAAARIAAAAQGPGARVAAAFTGRANLYADAPGLAILDPAQIDRLNLIDEAITIATVAPHEFVEAGQIVATVKIIPFAVPEHLVAAAEAAARAGNGAVGVRPFRALRAGLVQTRMPATKDSVIAKTERTMRDRLQHLGSDLVACEAVPHDPSAVADAIKRQRALNLSPILVVGDTAIVDRRDVIPAAIEMAGGEIVHFGMPVDPGNLLLLGRIGECPVVGVPGCARSPKVNGFDWVLQRICADIALSGRDIQRMGAGGLLKEIPSRPMPRAAGDADQRAAVAPRRPRTAVIILAAGFSSRMGDQHKLLASLEGKPILRHVVEHALQTTLRPIIVVTGHRASEVEAAAGSGELIFVRNPTPEAGLASSLAAGIAALPAGLDAALICLGDMPDVTAETLEKLVAAYNPAEGRKICVPVKGSKRGNPVLWGSDYFNNIKNLSGDSGAKHLLSELSEYVCEVPVSSEGILTDIDTLEALQTRRVSPTGKAT